MVNVQTSQPVKVGVLALQGSYDEHIHIINKLAVDGVTAFQVRCPADLEQCQGLILPGGESTTISLIASKSGLLEPLRDFVREARRGRKAVWGTCAGMILLANSVVGAKPGFEGLHGIACSVVRNQWGRQ
ncbi:Senecionine N-oxygenase, partial [Microbotryomycetes sp. JL201]